MVYRGPSEGCRPCRKRKVKCPKEKPFCRHCIRRKTLAECIYDNLETEWSSQQVTILTPSSSGSSGSGYLIDQQSPLWNFEIIPALTLEPNDQALCFFDAFYVRGPRELRTNIWAEQIMPRLSKQAPESVLTLSTAAVATQMLNKERGITIRSPVALKSYLKAVALLRTMLDSGIESHYQDILPSIFMLEIFETISNIAGESEYTAIHQNAGMRTIQRGLELKLKVATATQSIASALQSRYVWTCFAKGTPASLFAINDRSYPGACGELDIYGAEAANILHERDILLSTALSSPQHFQSPSSSLTSLPESATAISALLLRTIKLLTDLKAYYDRLPQSWRPQRISVLSPDYHPSIRAAGVYQSLSDVYASLPTSHGNALYRVVRIAALQTRWLLEQRLAALSSARSSTADPNADTYDTDMDAMGSAYDCKPEIQSLVDDICAAVPFHLGNRGASTSTRSTSNGSSANNSRRSSSTNTTNYEAVDGNFHPSSSPIEGDPRATHYPPSSLRLRKLAHFVDEHGNISTMTDAAHESEAATKGGFMILVPLGLLLSVFHRGATLVGNVQDQQHASPFKLRDGQMEWIQSQIMRATIIQTGISAK